MQKKQRRKIPENIRNYSIRLHGVSIEMPVEDKTSMDMATWGIHRDACRRQDLRRHGVMKSPSGCPLTTRLRSTTGSWGVHRNARRRQDLRWHGVLQGCPSECLSTTRPLSTQGDRREAGGRQDLPQHDIVGCTSNARRR